MKKGKRKIKTKREQDKSKEDQEKTTKDDGGCEEGQQKRDPRESFGRGGCDETKEGGGNHHLVNGSTINRGRKAGVDDLGVKLLLVLGGVSGLVGESAESLLVLGMSLGVERLDILVSRGPRAGRDGRDPTEINEARKKK